MSLLAWAWTGLAVVWLGIVWAAWRKVAGYPVWPRRSPEMRAAIKSEAAAIRRAAWAVWGIR